MSEQAQPRPQASLIPWVVAAILLAALSFFLSRYIATHPPSPGGVADTPAMALVIPEESLPSGNLQVLVLDGMTETPIPDARVVIPETGKTYRTDARGKTSVIQVPILSDQRYSDILPMPWGEVTVLVYANGYLDYALFHVQITQNTTRQGPTALLFRPENAPSAQPFSIIEGPARSWVNELLEQYRNQGE